MTQRTRFDVINTVSNATTTFKMTMCINLNNNNYGIINNHNNSNNRYIVNPNDTANISIIILQCTFDSSFLIDSNKYGLVNMSNKRDCVTTSFNCDVIWSCFGFILSLESKFKIKERGSTKSTEIRAESKSINNKWMTIKISS